LKADGTTQELNLEVQIGGCVFTFTVKLEKWSFHVADLPRMGKKCTEMKKAFAS